MVALKCDDRASYPHLWRRELPVGERQSTDRDRRSPSSSQLNGASLLGETGFSSVIMEMCCGIFSDAAEWEQLCSNESGTAENCILRLL